MKSFLRRKHAQRNAHHDADMDEIDRVVHSGSRSSNKHAPSRFSLATLTRRSGSRKSSNGRLSLAARLRGGSQSKPAREARQVTSCGGFCDHRPVSLYFITEFWEAILQEELAEDVELCVVQRDQFCSIKGREVCVRKGTTVRRKRIAEDDNVEVIVPEQNNAVTIIKENLLFTKERNEWTVEDVACFVIRTHPLVKDTQAPFNDVLAGDDPTALGKPHQGIFISYPRSMRFHDMLSTLHLRFDGRSPKKSFVWLDIFGASQATPIAQTNSVREEVNRGNLEAQRKAMVELGLDRLVRQMGDVALIMPSWDTAEPFSRMWCIWELYFAAKHETKFSVLTTPQLTPYMPVRLIENCEDMLSAIQSINFKNANCTISADAKLLQSACEKRRVDPDIVDEMAKHLLQQWMLGSIRNLIASRKRYVRSDEHRLEQAALLENEAIILLGEGAHEEAVVRLKEALAYAKACAGSHNIRVEELNDILAAIQHGENPTFSTSKKGATTTVADAAVAAAASPAGGEGRNRRRTRGSSASAGGVAGGDAPWDGKSVWSRSSGGSTKMSQASSSNSFRTGWGSMGTRGGDQSLRQHTVDEVTELHNEGVNLTREGRSEEAYDKLSQALVAFRKLGPKDKDDTLAASILASMASVLDEQGNFKLALKRSQEALEIRRRILGDIHMDVALNMCNVGKIMSHMGATSEAFDMLTSAMAVSGQLEHNPKTLIAKVDILIAVADVLSNQNYLNEALKRLDEAVSIVKSYTDIDASFPEAEVESTIADILQHASVICIDHGEYNEAMSRAETARMLFESAYGPKSSKLADCINNLAVIYDEQGLTMEAIDAYSTALSIFVDTLGEDHPRVGDAYYNMGAEFLQLKRYNEALMCYSKALQIFIASNHPHAALTYNNIAVVHEVLGQYDEAYLACKQAVTAFEDTFGPDHPQTVRSRSKLARLQRRRNRELAANNPAMEKKKSSSSKSKSRKAKGDSIVDEDAIAKAAAREDKKRVALYLAKMREDCS